MFHLSLPLRVAPNGRLSTVAQDSAADVAQSLGVLLATRPGERVAVPTYGTPDPQADGPDYAATQAAAAYWEPRTAVFDVELDVTHTGLEAEVS